MKKTKILVEEVLVASNAKILISVTVICGTPATATMVGKSSSGDVEIEVVSVGMVNSPPAPSNKQALNVKLLRGITSSLKGSTLEMG